MRRFTVPRTTGGTGTRLRSFAKRETTGGTVVNQRYLRRSWAARQMTVAGQTQVVYSWDNANRLTHITKGSDVIQFAYDNAGRRTSITLANGVVQSFGYDNAGWLTSIIYSKGAATL